MEVPPWPHTSFKAVPKEEQKGREPLREPTDPSGPRFGLPAEYTQLKCPCAVHAIIYHTDGKIQSVAQTLGPIKWVRKVSKRSAPIYAPLRL